MQESVGDLEQKALRQVKEAKHEDEKADMKAFEASVEDLLPGLSF